MGVANEHGLDRILIFRFLQQRFQAAYWSVEEQRLDPARHQLLR
jgi:hypothetical protein